LMFIFNYTGNSNFFIKIFYLKVLQRMKIISISDKMDLFEDLILSRQKKILDRPIF